MVNQTTKSIFSSPDSLPPNFKKALVASGLAGRKYLRWDSPGVEVIPAGEEDHLKAVIEKINNQQGQKSDNRDLGPTEKHSRTHGIVKGTFEIPANLPNHLRQGELFAKPAIYPAACRYSTEPGDPGLSDAELSPRRFSVKFFNVQGDFFDVDETTHTQDMEFNSIPAGQSPDARVTREVLDIRLKADDGVNVINKAFQPQFDNEDQKARSQVRNSHPASLRQYSQSAYRFGDYVMKYSLVPSTTTQESLSRPEFNPNEQSLDTLHLQLQNFHKNHNAEYLLQVQLLENLSDQHAESAEEIWNEEKYPWQTVGTLKIPKQESFGLERSMFWEEHVQVDPWRGLKAYQPLGRSSRLRRVVDRASGGVRKKLHGTEEVVVKSIDDIPD